MTIKQQQSAALRAALGDEAWKYLEEETMRPYASWREFPTCPFCGEEEHDWWDGVGQKNDGDTWLIKCSECRNTYRVMLSIEASFKSEVVA
uniref:Restriction alleviation protein n=1 Tax=viral metagenome TaxID=1070528 RepID=A0A6M3L4A1_9ZZZZ